MSLTLAAEHADAALPDLNLLSDLTSLTRLSIARLDAVTAQPVEPEVRWVGGSCLLVGWDGLGGLICWWWGMGVEGCSRLWGKADG